MTQDGVRNKLFLFIVLSLGLLLTYIEVYDTVDSALLLYVIAEVVIGLCFTIWAIWWFLSIRKPTVVFNVVLLVFICFLYNIGLQIWARYNFVYHSQEYLKIIVDSILWAYRDLPLVIIFLWLFCWIVGRLLGDPEACKILDSLDKGKINILLVEDDATLSNTLKGYMDYFGFYSVTQAYSYEEALRIFEPNKFVCIFIDLHLGKATNEGVELATTFRREDKCVYLSVISGYLRTDTAFQEVLLETIDDFIQKPVEFEYFRLKLLLWSIKYSRRVSRIDNEALPNNEGIKRITCNISRFFKKEKRDANVQK